MQSPSTRHCTHCRGVTVVLHTVPLGQQLLFAVHAGAGSQAGGLAMQVFEPEQILRAIERERITSTTVVPTMLGRLVALGPEVLRKYDTSSLRWIMSGAAPLPTELARRVEDALERLLAHSLRVFWAGLCSGQGEGGGPRSAPT